MATAAPAADRNGRVREWTEIRLVEEALRSGYLALRDGDCVEDCDRPLQELRPWLQTASGHAYLDTTVASLRNEVLVRSQYRRFNEAVEWTNAGRLDDADRLLAQLEQEPLEAELRSRVESLRGRIRSRLR
jgi:hypothetical protein